MISSLDSEIYQLKTQTKENNDKIAKLEENVAN